LNSHLQCSSLGSDRDEVPRGAVSYREAYAVARSRLVAPADLGGLGLWHYGLLLIELDSVHLVFSAHYSLVESRELLLLILEMADNRIVAVGDEVIGLELLLGRSCAFRQPSARRRWMTTSWMLHLAGLPCLAISPKRFRMG
jgi:hypothetical protein